MLRAVRASTQSNAVRFWRWIPFKDIFKTKHEKQQRKSSALGGFCTTSPPFLFTNSVPQQPRSYLVWTSILLCSLFRISSIFFILFAGFSLIYFTEFLIFCEGPINSLNFLRGTWYECIYLDSIYGIVFKASIAEGAQILRDIS